MGARKQAVVLLTACVLILSVSTPVHAETTAVDLYEFYDMSYSLVYPEGVIQTINDYRYAQRYTIMYSSVDLMYYDGSFVESRIHALQQRKASIENSLQNGFNLPRDTIYALESEYVGVLSQLEVENKRLEVVDTSELVPTRDHDGPSYDEYVEACNTRAEIEKNADIGSVSVPMPFPTVSSHVLTAHTSKTTMYTVADGTSVSALWNGEVISVGENWLIISCHNSILLGYSGMKTMKVSVGDTVYQGQTIGTATDMLSLALSLDGTFVDISKLFEEE